MKNMWESSETFDAFARIDFSYFSIKKISETFLKMQPKSNLDFMIDKATGYDKSKHKETGLAIIELLDGIIKDKIFIEANYDSDLNMKNNIKEILSKIK